jgi:hypothetical protein
MTVGTFALTHKHAAVDRKWRAVMNQTAFTLALGLFVIGSVTDGFAQRTGEQSTVARPAVSDRREPLTPAERERLAEAQRIPVRPTPVPSPTPTTSPRPNSGTGEMRTVPPQSIYDGRTPRSGAGVAR